MGWLYIISILTLLFASHHLETNPTLAQKPPVAMHTIWIFIKLYQLHEIYSYWSYYISSGPHSLFPFPTVMQIVFNMLFCSHFKWQIFHFTKAWSLYSSLKFILTHFIISSFKLKNISDILSIGGSFLFNSVYCSTAYIFQSIF